MWSLKTKEALKYVNPSKQGSEECLGLCFFIILQQGNAIGIFVF